MHYFSVAVTQYSVRVTCGPVQVEPLSVQMKLSPVQAESSFLHVERSTGARRITRRSNRLSPSADRDIGQVMSSCGRVARSRRAVGLVRPACMVVSTYCTVKVRNRTLVSAAVRVGCLNSRAISAERTINSPPRLASSRRCGGGFCCNRVVSQERTAEMSTQ